VGFRGLTLEKDLRGLLRRARKTLRICNAESFVKFGKRGMAARRTSEILPFISLGLRWRL